MPEPHERPSWGKSPCQVARSSARPERDREPPLPARGERSATEMRERMPARRRVGISCREKVVVLHVGARAATLERRRCETIEAQPASCEGTNRAILQLPAMPLVSRISAFLS